MLKIESETFIVPLLKALSIFLIACIKCYQLNS